MFRGPSNVLIRQGRNTLIRNQYPLPITNHQIQTIHKRKYSTPTSSPNPNSPDPNPPTSPSPSSKVLPKSSLIQRYAPSLSLLSTRTGVPLPSLGLSFLILHELTAILPVILIYWIFASLGIGGSLVNWILNIGENVNEHKTNEVQEIGWKNWVKDWYIEGQGKIERVAKRYGILGYEKSTSKRTEGEEGEGREGREEGGGKEGVGEESKMIMYEDNGAASKVADAIAAYVVVKALLPLRIAISIGAAPTFARYTLNPIQNVIRRFRR